MENPEVTVESLANKEVLDALARKRLEEHPLEKKETPAEGTAGLDCGQEISAAELVRNAILQHTSTGAGIASEEASEDEPGLPTLNLCSGGASKFGTGYKAIIELLAATLRVFISTATGDVLHLVERNGRATLEVVKRHTLGGIMALYINLLSRGQYVLFPAGQAELFLKHPARLELPQIHRLIHSGGYDANWNLLKPGYNEEAATYVYGDVIEPVESFETWNELLKDFCFEDEASRTNYIGSILGNFCYGAVGRGPLLAISGNMRLLGKTLLAQIAQVLIDGYVSDSLTYTSDDTEFEKRIGTKLKKGTRVPLIDNLKSKNRRKELGSACLERMLTDEIITTRRLHSSDDITCANDILFILTMNDGLLSPDLTTRSVPVALRYYADPRKRKFKLSRKRILAFVQKHRAQLIAELLGMVEVWRRAGMPMKTDAKHRVDDWSEAVGGILQVNGLRGFLSNVERVEAEHDRVLHELLRVVTSLANEKSFGYADVIRQADALKVLEDELPSWKRQKSREQAASDLLERVVGKKIEFDGQMVHVSRVPKSRLVTFTIACEELIPNNDEQEGSVIAR